MDGGGADDILKEQMVIENLPAEYRELIQAHDTEPNQIHLVFTANGLGSDGILKAKTVFISCLRGRENEEAYIVPKKRLRRAEKKMLSEA